MIHIVPESKIKMKKMRMKQKFYQYINFNKCETSYLRKIDENIFVFLLGPASENEKMRMQHKFY